MVDPSAKLSFGFDLGTTNSCIATWNPNKETDQLQIIPIGGLNTSPSVMAVPYVKNNKWKEIKFGNQATNELPKNSLFISEVKRFIGRPYPDESHLEEKRALDELKK